MLKELAKLEIPATPLVSEGSWGARGVGSHASTMTLYEDMDANGNVLVFIEWDIDALDTTEEIGLELESNVIVGYDGVMSFPRPAKPWLESLGYVFSDDME